MKIYNIAHIGYRKLTWNFNRDKKKKPNRTEYSTNTRYLIVENQIKFDMCTFH